jgi:rhodanese-related sulfurtransferase
MSLPFHISPANLRLLMASSDWPLVLDVCIDPDREAAGRMVPTARLAVAEDILAGRYGLPEDRPIVVVCQKGRKISQGVAAELRRRGQSVLRWIEEGHPTVSLAALRTHSGTAARPFVTRRRPKIDRVACPWLIRRFVDPDARFWYVDDDQVQAVAERADAIPYDIPGVAITHAGDLCSFDALVTLFGLTHDAALARVALIVRGADTAAFDLAPQAAGLLAISLGLSARAGDDDHGMLEDASRVYDALYAWALSAADETHSWAGPR